MIFSRIILVCFAGWLNTCLVQSSCADSLSLLQVNYEFTYEIQDGKPGLSVKIDFAGNSKGEQYLQLPNRWGGNTDLHRLISNLTVSAGQKIGQVIDTDKPEQKKIIFTPDQPVTIRYRLETLNAVFQYPNYQPVIDQQGLYFVGSCGLVLLSLEPDSIFQLNCIWKIPNYWVLRNSFSKNAQTTIEPDGTKVIRHTQNVTNREYFQALFVGGSSAVYRVLERPLGSDLVVMMIQGQWAFSDDDLMSKLLKIIAIEREFFRAQAMPYFVVAIRPADTHIDASGGVGLTNAFSVTLPADGQLDAKLLSLISHEYFHTWNQPALFGDRNQSGEYYWFIEGFTDYYMDLFLLRSGLIALPEYVSRLNNILASYYTSPVRELPNRSIRDNFWLDYNVQKLPYQRGNILAHRWNALLRMQSMNQQSLDNLVRDWILSAQAPNAPKLNFKRFSEMLMKTLPSAGLDQDLEKIQAGDLLSFGDNILGPCVRKGQKQISRYGFDFDMRQSIVTGKIVRLKINSKTYQQGLREGDQIVEFRQLSKKNQIQFLLRFKHPDQTGLIQELQLTAQSEQSVSVPQFVVSEPVDPTFCLKWYQET